MIVSLYAGGMTVRDIEHHRPATVRTELSRETIPKIVDEVPAWQHRPLELFNPVIFLDAMIVKIRDRDLSTTRPLISRSVSIWKE